MKKLLIIITILVYGLSATGATIHLHFCCGKLDKVSLSDNHNENCPKKGFASKGCCDSKQVDLKVKADQNLTAKWVTTFMELGTASPLAGYQELVGYDQPLLQPFTTGPPVEAGPVPLYLKHCVFRI